MTAYPRIMSHETRVALQALNQTRWWERSACIGAPFDLFDGESDRRKPRGRRRVDELDGAVHAPEEAP